MANNAEILAQLEKLASAAAAGVKIRFECDDLFGVAFLSVLQDSCFPQILAAARRWVKIEEAARECRRLDLWSVDSESFGSDCDITDEMEQWFDKHRKARAAAYSILDAALKEPS